MDNQEMKTRGDRIRFARNEMELTQLQLAKLVGVSSVAIGHWENDRAIGNVDSVFLLAKTLNVTIDWLLTGNNSGSIDSVELLPNRDIDKPYNKHILTVPRVDQRGQVIPGENVQFLRKDAVAAGVNASALRAAKLTNRSMVPTMYPDTEMSFDSSDTEVRDGGIYVYISATGVEARYIYNESPTHYRLRAENIAEYPQTIVRREDVEILGRVWWWSVFRHRK